MNRRIGSVSEFMSVWGRKNDPSPRLAEDYLGICRNIMYESESSLSEVLDVVKKNMENWAIRNSSVYLRSKPFYSKEDLEEKTSWYVPKALDDSVDTHTSGSSTGFHFTYRRMKSTFERLEWDNHYDMVLDEFGVGSSPNVLYFFPEHFKKSEGVAVFCESTSQPYLNSHGRSRSSSVHYANFDMYRNDPSSFFSLLFDYLERTEIDVLFSSGPCINSMCHHIRKFGVKDRIAGLLSQTNEMMLQEDAEFLFVKNSYFDNVCDHMRCWDGGASFFTCRFGNYHIMDNLSWCDDVEGRLVSTDYFNFASPFVRYWNGDICSIGKTFSRCECGRLFREFEFLENRPFSLSGVCLGDLRSGMVAIGTDCITQVRCYADSINVVSSRVLSDQERLQISLLEPKFNFVFSVEGP